MKNILADRQRATLEEFLGQKLLLAFDFDGTLAPLVPEPSAAAIPPKTRRLLQALARHYPCAVISGRARGDVLARLTGISLRAVFGNHGIEPVRHPGLVRRRVARWRQRLRRDLPAIPGVIIEDKGVSLALHYRQTRRRAEARRVLLAAAGSLPASRLMEGKMVVNVLPSRTGNKGTALMGLCHRLRCEAAIYGGDDDNDEDVFALAGDRRLLGIRVGRSRTSHAAYFVPRQAAVNELLMRMLAIKTRPARD